jgi:membrane-bound lytic murein transglycosylase D
MEVMVVNPGGPFGIAWQSLTRQRMCRGCLLALAAALVALGGCSATASRVKNDLDYRPAVANAISKALALGTEFRKAPPPKPSSYPPLPSDENAPRVRRFVRGYAYDQRETLKAYLAAAEPYLGMAKKIARENELPEDVAYLFLLESGANPEARSHANALGMWQFMPATARSYGLRVDSWVDERLDPIKSTKAAMLYLKDLYGMFGCWRLALSAYNSGENKLNQVLCQEDADDYEEICSSRRLKQETREFFPKFQAIVHIAKNAAKFGFAAPSENAEEPQHEALPVDGSYSLKKLAILVGASESELSEMNPALVRAATPPEGDGFSLRVPLGKKETLERRLKDLQEDKTFGHVVHVVAKGDSVPKILKRYGVNKNELAAVNPDVNLRKGLKTGEKILVPSKKTHTKAPSRKVQRITSIESGKKN